MRSFRILKSIDRKLDAHASRRGWSKSYLIRDIITGWLTFNEVKEKVE